MPRNSALATYYRAGAGYDNHQFDQGNAVLTNSEPLSEIERLLLMAAAVLRLGPDTKSRAANTYKVIKQVLQWTNMLNDEVRAELNGGVELPVILNIYDTLVRMTRERTTSGPSRAPERPGEVLFDGEGNWGIPGELNCSPSNPRFNACYLTAYGEQVAQQLLEQYPQYR